LQVVVSVVDQRDPEALDSADVIEDQVIEVVGVADVSAVLLVDDVAGDEDAVEDQDQLEQHVAVDLVLGGSNRVVGLLGRGDDEVDLAERALGKEPTRVLVEEPAREVVSRVELRAVPIEYDEIDVRQIRPVVRLGGLRLQGAVS
jgi:hypothetical protein